MLILVFNAYLVSSLLNWLSVEETSQPIPRVVSFEKIKNFVKPKFMSVSTVIKSPRFRKFFKRTLKYLFYALLFLSIIKMLKKFLLLYNLFQKEQTKLLEDAGEKLIDLLITASGRLADRMIKFLKDHNLESGLTRSQWMEFFREMLMGSTEAYETFEVLLLEIIKEAFKSHDFQIEALKSYKKCLLETPQENFFPQLHDKRFLYSLRKIKKTYWEFSYLQLEMYLEFLLALYARSNFTNTQVLMAIKCIQRELEKRINTPR